jgi:hypothetical protein
LSIFGAPVFSVRSYVMPNLSKIGASFAHLGHDAGVAPHLTLKCDLPLGELAQQQLGAGEIDADAAPAHRHQHGDQGGLQFEQFPQSLRLEQRALLLKDGERHDDVVDGVGRDDLRRRAPDVIARVALAEVLDQPMIHRRVGLGNLQVVLGERVETVRESRTVDQRLGVLHVPERPGDIDAGGVQEAEIVEQVRPDLRPRAAELGAQPRQHGIARHVLSGLVRDRKIIAVAGLGGYRHAGDERVAVRARSVRLEIDVAGLYVYTREALTL